ncbi:hypothetical protein ACQP2U_36135 [Nocardia sp. CA-084685]|uniref:hypothetical protein n=1 Tax=Nocardia sp. CA-084685 TaxID=3239970 RepID=UPI003D97A45A
MDDDRLKVESDNMRNLSGDLTELAGKIRAVMNNLESATEPLMDRPVCGTHEPGENFQKDYGSQRDAIQDVGTSYVRILEGDFATNFDEGAKLLDKMEGKNKAEIDKIMRSYKA